MERDSNLFLREERRGEVTLVKMERLKIDKTRLRFINFYSLTACDPFRNLVGKVVFNKTKKEKKKRKKERPLA